MTGTRRASRTGRVFEEVLSVHFDALFRTALRLCRGHAADAEDLVQEVALRAFRQFQDLREIDAARSWLFRILMRTHLNRRRSESRHPEVAIDDLDERAFERALEAWRVPETPDQVFARAHLAGDVAEALDALDPPLRAVVQLVDVEGFRQWEVATMLRIPEGTVASRLYRARRALRERLAKDQGRGRRRTLEGC